MSGFFVLNVPEFESLLGMARRNPRCTVHPPRSGYTFVEFDLELDIQRSETSMSDAVWFGCLTAGLVGKITRFTADSIRLVATNEPVLSAPRADAPGVLAASPK